NMVEKNDFLTLDPFINSAPSACYEVYERLFAFSSYDGDAGPVLCDVNKGNCGGYTHEAGSGVYTFHLCENIYDHRGNQITASDVDFSFRHYFESNSINSSAYRILVTDEATDNPGWQVTGEYDITFTFQRELTGLREMEALITVIPIVSEKSYNELDGNLTTEECGTGPYYVESFTSGSSTTLKIYEDYWQTNDDVKNLCQMQNVEVINYTYAPDASQQIMALEAGEVDLVQDASVDFVNQFRDKNQYGINVISYLQSGCIRLGANHMEDNMFSNKDLRLAVFYAVDNQAFVTAMGGDNYGVATPATWGAGQADFQDEWNNMENYNTVCDLELSKKYQEAAGYNGEKIVLLAETSLEDAAILVGQMLENAGFNIELAVVDNTTQRTRSDTGDYDLFISNMAGYCGAMMIQNNLSRKYDLNGVKVGSDFINDQEWLDMADLISSLEGHTDENVLAWQARNIDEAHYMGLATTWINLLVNENIVSVCRTDKNKLLPGGFTYADPNA
ncbi:MAG: ABC transporter substrate-binding protein, partial [Oscillospiraceae bacterium]